MEKDKEPIVSHEDLLALVFLSQCYEDLLGMVVEHSLESEHVLPFYLNQLQKEKVNSNMLLPKMIESSNAVSSSSAAKTVKRSTVTKMIEGSSVASSSSASSLVC